MLVTLLEGVGWERTLDPVSQNQDLGRAVVQQNAMDVFKKEKAKA
jgi:hypothetical protein